MCATVSTQVILLKYVHFSRTEVKVRKHTLKNTQRQGRKKKIKGKNIIFILVIASRYTEVKPLASGHNERL